MALQDYANDRTYFAPCTPSTSKSITPASPSAEVRGIQVNVTEGPLGFGVTAILPDLEEDDIALTAEPGNIIVISAERVVTRTVQKQGKNRTYSSTEETSEFLRRSLKLPDSANLDKVNSSYQNGVLTLLIAKDEESSKADPAPVVVVD